MFLKIVKNGKKGTKKVKIIMKMVKIVMKMVKIVMKMVKIFVKMAKTDQKFRKFESLHKRPLKWSKVDSKSQKNYLDSFFFMFDRLIFTIVGYLR